MSNSTAVPTTSPEKTSPFDPEKAFLDLPIVRLTISLIIIAAAIATTLISIHGNYKFDFSASGFNDFVQDFKFPLGLLTVSIPMLALLAANHRSEQTKRQMSLTMAQISRTDQQITRTDQQIKIAQGQNIFSNHFKHLEEFDKRFKKKDGVAGFYLSSTQKIHHVLFPQSRKGIFSIDQDVMRDIIGNVNSFFETSREFNHPNWMRPAGAIHKNMAKFIQKYRIEVGMITGRQVVPENQESFVLINDSVKGSFIHFLQVFRFVDEILSFDEDYETPQILGWLLKIDPSLIETDKLNQKTFVEFDIDLLVQIATGVRPPRKLAQVVAFA